MKPIDLAYPSLGDRVFEAVRDAISRKELVPGTLYSVAAISEQMGVSRTPVREALLQLAAHSVVRFEPNRGVRILQITIKDIEEIYNLRLLLEVPCAYQAALLIDDEGKQKLTAAFQAMESSLSTNDESMFQQNDLMFHMLILETGGNDRIVEAVKVTRAQMHARGLSTTPTRTLAAILDPHRKLYEAIMNHDPEAAALAAQKHLRSTLQILVQQSQEDEETSRYEPGLNGWFERVERSFS
ncbi:MAG: GntR family transcriptional regulator [Leucobacter sp.]